NSFAPEGDAEGPFALHLSIDGSRLVFDIRREGGAAVMAHLLSLTPLRRIVKDYYMVCDSYYEAIRTATPDRIEALDMGRRGIHDEGSRTLMERLDGKVRIDFETARRLFTLISVLHWKGGGREHDSLSPSFRGAPQARTRNPVALPCRWIPGSTLRVVPE